MRPFENIRIVDFTQVISGPYATYQLATLGADVIKVEQRGAGDQGRNMLAPTPAALEAGMSALFTAVNCGKRSITLDLKRPEALAVVEALVRSADVVVENFKAGTLERLGIGPDVLMGFNPKLVLCRISGFGQTGPRSASAAYDPVIQAISGIMAVTGTEQSGPIKTGFWVTDMAAGMNAAFAIASALYRRSERGRGEVIDVSMLDTAVSLMSPLAGLFVNYGVDPPFTGNGTPGTGGSSSVYPTMSGYLTIAAATDAQFKKLMVAIERPELTDDERFATRADRLQNSAQYREIVVDGLSTDTAANWERRLAEVGVPAGANQKVSQLPEDSQLKHRKLFHPLPGPVGLPGPFSAVNVGFKLDRDGPRVDRAPPAVGQHTDEVLSELGYEDTSISKLRDGGVV